MIPGIGMLIRDDDRNQGSVPGDRSQKLMSINGSRAPRQAGGGRWPVAGGAEVHCFSCVRAPRNLSTYSERGPLLTYVRAQAAAAPGQAAERVGGAPLVERRQTQVVRGGAVW